MALKSGSDWEIDTISLQWEFASLKFQESAAYSQHCIQQWLMPVFKQNCTLYKLHLTTLCNHLIKYSLAEF